MQEQIIRTDYAEVMQKSYVDYAMSVIISRALPDIRDGLKPVQRRTLYDTTEAERRKNCESTKYETIHMASHNFHNFTKFDRSNYDLKCKKSDAWFW